MHKNCCVCLHNTKQLQSLLRNRNPECTQPSRRSEPRPRWPTSMAKVVGICLCFQACTNNLWPVVQFNNKFCLLNINRRINIWSGWGWCHGEYCYQNSWKMTEKLAMSLAGWRSWLPSCLARAWEVEWLANLLLVVYECFKVEQKLNKQLGHKFVCYDPKNPGSSGSGMRNKFPKSQKPVKVRTLRNICFDVVGIDNRS